MPELLKMASCSSDWKRISVESSFMFPRRPSQLRDWAGLIHTDRCFCTWTHTDYNLCLQSVILYLLWAVGSCLFDFSCCKRRALVSVFVQSTALFFSFFFFFAFCDIWPPRCNGHLNYNNHTILYALYDCGQLTFGVRDNEGSFFFDAHLVVWGRCFEFCDIYLQRYKVCCMIFGNWHLESEIQRLTPTRFQTDIITVHIVY